MSRILASATKGYSCLASWSDLIDTINVFPVADGDTGANLRISLAPLQKKNLSHAQLPELLARAAVGNSGNIAVAFFRKFLRASNPRHLAAMTREGLASARQSVLAPRSGTMLDVFESLAALLPDDLQPVTQVEFLPLCGQLQNTVLGTCDLLPELREAGVVDAGALAMFVFFEGFFKALTNFPGPTSSLSRLFGEKLVPNTGWQPEVVTGHCIDVVFKPGNQDGPGQKELVTLGESIVVSRQEQGLKIHLHSNHPEQVREKLQAMGEVLSWKEENMAGQALQSCDPAGPVHILTDAAGSLDRKTAQALGITLLDSYIVAGDGSWPESLCHPEKIYRRQRAGQRVTTAQASNYERHQQYTSALQQYERVLYICTGSVYTGNYAAAAAWQAEHDGEGRFTIIDSGAASGRLALIALTTAGFAREARDYRDVERFARRQCTVCREYVFIDSLSYLAAGGRISRTKSFLGDLLHMKPVISPMAEGVVKKGVVRNRDEQLAFARRRLASETEHNILILLQYSDNRKWLEQIAATTLQHEKPRAEIIICPLSLTSGVHMGPGTWAMAFVPREEK